MKAACKLIWEKTDSSHEDTLTITPSKYHCFVYGNSHTRMSLRLNPLYIAMEHYILDMLVCGSKYTDWVNEQIFVLVDF